MPKRRCTVLNVKKQANSKNGREAIRYYEEHLARDDYYAERGTAIGVWFGKAASGMGLESGSAVDPKAFAELVDGRTPSGERLTRRTKKNRVAYYDTVLSAPKAVSILALVAGDERLIQAHEAAAQETMEQAERLIRTRVRAGRFAKSNETRITSNILAAAFTHKTSRALDPQLHTHFVTFNVTHDNVEGIYKAIHNATLYECYDFYLQVYRSSLARRMRDLGYEVDKSGKRFRVEGIDPKIEKLFSKRSTHIRKLEAELAEKGVSIANNGRALLALLSRQEKKHLTPDELLQFQVAQLSSDDLSTLKSIVASARANVAPTQNPLSKEQWLDMAKAAQARTAPINSELLPKAINDVFQRVTVASEEQILAKALEFSSDGYCTVDALRAELASEKYIRINGQVTTKEAQRREAKLIAFASRRPNTSIPPLGQKKGLTGLSFTQKLAAGTVLSSRDAVTILRGLAGTGKTTTLGQIIKNLSLKPSAHVIVVAPSTSAVETLHDELAEKIPEMIDSKTTKIQTMQRLLISEPDQRMLKNGVLVVDEAGLASNKDIEGLFDIAKKQQCRVLLVGDQKQHQSVEAGDALRILMKHATCTKATLWKIRRQTDEYKQVIRAIDKGEIGKSWKLLNRGWIVEGTGETTRKSMISQVPTAEARAETVCDHYLKLTDLSIDGRKPSALIITPTWDEHERVSDAMRRKLKERGEIAKRDHTFKILKSLILTDEQKKHYGYYEEGQVLLVHRRVRTLKKGDLLTVTSVAGKYLNVRKQDGKEFTVNPKKIGPDCEVMRETERTFSIGDQIMLQANYSAGRTRLANGSIHKITDIRDNGDIVLEKGRVLPATYRTFVHGYATTSHKSQSKTVDFAILSADSHQTGALSTRQWLVSLSRGRKAAYVYTDDVNRLYEASHLVSDRKSALELLEHSIGGRETISKIAKLMKRLPHAKDWLRHQKYSERVKQSGSPKKTRSHYEKDQ